MRGPALLAVWRDHRDPAYLGAGLGQHREPRSEDPVVVADKNFHRWRKIAALVGLRQRERLAGGHI
jgi:hypothetical protein